MALAPSKDLLGVFLHASPKAGALQLPARRVHFNVVKGKSNKSRIIIDIHFAGNYRYSDIIGTSLSGIQARPPGLRERHLPGREALPRPAGQKHSGEEGGRTPIKSLSRACRTSGAKNDETHRNDLNFADNPAFTRPGELAVGSAKTLLFLAVKL